MINKFDIELVYFFEHLILKSNYDTDIFLFMEMYERFYYH